MKILDLEHCSIVAKSCRVSVDKTITGGARADTFAGAHADGDLATASASANAVGDYSRTYTSTRTSSRKNRHGSTSWSVAAAYASARSGVDTDISSSLKGSSSFVSAR